LPFFSISTTTVSPDKNSCGLIEDTGNDIATGPDGNVYVTGYIFGGADIAGTSFFDTQTNEMFLARFNPNGQLQWGSASWWREWR
jgi:hypothetical protein